ncbi:hypothetical protein [Pseudomonas sp. Marseille-QA0892]
MEFTIVERLRIQRRRLLRSYVVHVVWFSAMIISAALQATRMALVVSIVLALVTVVPVIAYAHLVHRTCRAIDPGAKTIGLVPMIIMTVMFTPFESGLVVPAKNLVVSGRLLKRLNAAAAANESSALRGKAVRPVAGPT